MLSDNWNSLTREHKRDLRLKKFIEQPGVKFKSPQAAAKYKERATRFALALTCQVPDRVPVLLPSGNFPAYNAGYNLKTILNDYAKLQESFEKFVRDFDDDMDDFFTEAHSLICAPGLELLDYRVYKWPGHGLKDEVNSYQWVEGAYMQADEYPQLLKDPADFAFHTLIPRMMGSLKPLEKFPSLKSLAGSPMGIMGPFSNPQIREAFQSLIEAGKEMQKMGAYAAAANRTILESGFPATRGPYVLAPFDIIGDFLRGTNGAILDMYRQPEALLEAVDIFTEQVIQRTIAAVNAVDGFIVHFPLHKGDDTFMSDKQFEKFYWPSLKKVIDALIEEGILVSHFAEGRYNRRLDYIGDFPKGWVIWQFDQTDMAKAKQLVGRTCCIEGNVPTSVLLTGTPAGVKDYCRRLIETCAPGGGYVLSGGATATEASPANLRAMMQAAREYGKY